MNVSMCMQGEAYCNASNTALPAIALALCYAMVPRLAPVGIASRLDVCNILPLRHNFTKVFLLRTHVQGWRKLHHSTMLSMLEGHTYVCTTKQIKLMP